MALFNWPQEKSDYLLSYNAMMAFITIGTGAWSQLTGDWLPFGAASFWSVLWLWDIYIRPTVWPETENEAPPAQEDGLEREFVSWMAGTSNRTQRELLSAYQKMTREVEELKKHQSMVTVEAADGE